MAFVLIILPATDFDPTEAGVAWQTLVQRGHEVRFATPNGLPAQADHRTLHGTGLGLWRPILQANKNGLSAYHAMAQSPAFAKPLAYEQVDMKQVSGLVLPGGHAAGMKPYLESERLQWLVRQAFSDQLPIGAICHGTVLAARSKRSDGRSVLYGKQTTGLIRMLELSGWALTACWLGNHYRTYPITVQEEVTQALERRSDFFTGPLPLMHDSPSNLKPGFVVRDGNYLSARWPGDAHRFAHDFSLMVEGH